MEFGVFNIMRIRTKTIIIFLILSLAPIAIIGTLAYQNGREALKESLGKSFQMRAEETIEMVDQNLYEVYQNVQTWAELDILQDVITGDIDSKISTFLMGLNREYGYFSHLYALNNQGEVVASSNTELIGRNFKFKLDDYYKNSVNGKAYLEDAYSDEILNTWIVSFYFPIKSKFDNGKVIGLLFAGWKVKELSKLIQSSEHKVYHDVHLILIRSDTLVLYESEFGNETMSKLSLGKSGLRSALLAGQTKEGYLVETDEHNKEYLIGYHYSTGHRDFPGLGWAALVIQDTKKVFAPIERLRILILSAGAIVGLFVILFSLIISRRMTNPILKISQVAGKVAKGNLDEKVDYSSSDEIGSLAKTFNQMIQDLRKRRAERQKMEEERLRSSKLESVGILAGGIAHDFNNILTGIVGNLSLALTYLKPDEKVRKLITEAEVASFRAKDLTQQLLTFSKGGMPIKKTVYISKLITDSVSFALRGSKINHTFLMPEDLSPVEIDGGQMSQVIHNLIINAVQAMPEGGAIEIKGKNITVEEAETLSLPKGKFIKLSIKDQGIGIPGKYLQNIFDPYFTTKKEGSGLGLASSYSIINKHEGLLTVESEMGIGTTFHIYLPASKEKVKLEKITKEEVKSVSGKGKILIMDDQEVIRNIVDKMLSSFGFQVESAVDGEEAINLYKKAKKSGEPFNAVILDLTVPGGMGGKEAIKKLLEIDPNVKAVVSSGHSNDPVMAEFKKYGFTDVVAKPYRTQEIRDVLLRVVNQNKK